MVDKKDNLTLLFFGMQSFEKCMEKMLLFMGLGIDLFLENKLKIIEADRLKLGYEANECDDGMEVCNIQCILYDIAGIDAKHKELFSVLNNNSYKCRIRFRYLDSVILNNERLLELHESDLEEEGSV